MALTEYKDFIIIILFYFFWEVGGPEAEKDGFFNIKNKQTCVCVARGPTASYSKKYHRKHRTRTQKGANKT